ncbi:MAG TPA: Hsp20/alpha crystallin family protein [Gemmataceae bacterium]|nr:Hsp20/alpha crystallin family protein [Gemmataceae bacterium]
MTETSKSVAPRGHFPFFPDADEFFERAMRRWPFNWPEASAGNQPRALRAFEHVPKVEVKENGKHYTVTCELPGLDEKDVKVIVDDDILNITGEKKIEQTDEKTHYSERSYGSFTRGFTLPLDADSSKLTAKFGKGVLTVEIPKSVVPSPSVKQVEIKSA